MCRIYQAHVSHVNCLSYVESVKHQYHIEMTYPIICLLEKAKAESALSSTNPLPSLIASLTEIPEESLDVRAPEFTKEPHIALLPRNVV